MSDTAHGTAVAVTGHQAGAGHDAHGDGHDAHGGGEALGPIDWKAWGAAVLGLVLALVISAALYIAQNP